MQFSYPEINSFNYQNMRFYKVTEGIDYPSVTTVLGSTAPPKKLLSLQAWRNSIGEEAADRITKAAADRGTSVHILAEKFLKNEEIDSSKFSSEEISAFNTIKTKLKKISSVWGQEVALYSNELKVAGRCDCIGIYKGMPCIIDYKTSSRIKKESDIEDYFLQLTAYAIMHNEMFKTHITHGVILMVSDLGFPQEFVKNVQDYKSALVERISTFYRKFL